MPLTDAKIKALKPKERQYKIGDEFGLFLLITPSGGKLWRWKFRFDGKQKELAIGKYPAISLKQARLARDEARSKHALGIDPTQEKKAKKEAASGAGSLEVIAREWFSIKESGWKPSHAKTILSRLENNVFPRLGSQKVTDIRPKEIIACLRKIEERGANETAHRVLQYFKAIFTHAVITERCETNPAAGLEAALKPVQHKHMAAITDPKELGEVLNLFDEYTGTPQVRAALQLMPMLLLRPGELRQLTWDQVNLETAEIRFSAAKTGIEMITPLATQAVQILSELKLYTESTGWVFPSTRPGRPLSDNGVLIAMRSLGLSKEKVSGHGFRATARTLLDEELRKPVAIIEMQLGHSVRDVHGKAYNRTQFLDDRKIMMQNWADYLDDLKAQT